MKRVLIVNPNASVPCSEGIAAAIAPFQGVAGIRAEVVGSPDGPPAILSWQDWHAAVGPMLAIVARQAADAYVIACASDPGIEAVRAATRVPVLGIFRAAIAAAMARGERFGVIAIVSASRARHLAALRAMGVEARLAEEVALDVSMDTLLDPMAARARLIEAARRCAAAGADSVVLGCTGMAHHRAAVEEAAGIAVIDPCQAGMVQALLALS